MYINNKILIGKNNTEELAIILDKANRHGLITGASGSGKTITLKVMAESFSSAGVPVFLADVKGDIAGTCLPGTNNEKIEERLKGLRIDDFKFRGFPIHFWDVFGKKGHPIRTTVKDVGPTILSRMLGLTEAGEGVLAIAFKIAEDRGLELIDLKDLKILLTYIGEHNKEFITTYGNITTQSIGVIQRNLLELDSQGGNSFFGEPNLDINDFLKTNNEGLGYINIMDCVELFKSPDLYSCFLLWLLTTLYETLPEVGDLEKPKIVFFFDEAHLLFDGMPSHMLKEVTGIVKLIRSKGIGLYFISQAPTDIPDAIISQLGNRVQHALRAYTPSEQKIVKTAANAFRTNKSFNTEEAILSLGTGEALISFQNEKGEPNIVEKCTILPPQSMMGSIDDGTRLMAMSNSLFKGKYDIPIDRESAYEKLSLELENEAKEKELAEKLKEEAKAKKEAEKEAEKRLKEEEKQRKAEEKAKKEREKAIKNSPLYKVGNKAKNKIVNKALNKGIDALFGTSKSSKKTSNDSIAKTILKSLFK